jgi:hypothetical protein
MINSRNGRYPAIWLAAFIAGVSAAISPHSTFFPLHERSLSVTATDLHPHVCVCVFAEKRKEKKKSISGYISSSKHGTGDAYAPESDRSRRFQQRHVILDEGGCLASLHFDASYRAGPPRDEKNNSRHRVSLGKKHRQQIQVGGRHDSMERMHLLCHTCLSAVWCLRCTMCVYACASTRDRLRVVCNGRYSRVGSNIYGEDESHTFHFPSTSEAQGFGIWNRASLPCGWPRLRHQAKKGIPFHPETVDFRRTRGLFATGHADAHLNAHRGQHRGHFAFPGHIN